MRTITTLLLLALSLTAIATDYDQNKPFGFCTVSSRTNAGSTYDCKGGGVWTYPIPEGFTGKVITLKSNGNDMKSAIQNAIKQYDVIILDGSEGDFIVSQNISFDKGNKTILGLYLSSLKSHKENHGDWNNDTTLQRGSGFLSL